jgi:cytoskeletal protein CcmA (bactofilin family)
LAVNGLVISGERKHTVGDSAALAATSCSEIKAYRPSAPSGQYWIQPNSSIAAFQAYCDMITDGGGWTIVTAVSGADGEQPLVSDTEATGSSPLTYNAYNISRAKKMALSLVSNEFMVRRNNGKWLKTNAAPFDQNLNTSNVHVDNAVTITASDGTTTTGVQGYSNYNITGGGDFGIVTAAGFDHHSTTYHHLNSGCGNSYLYSYSNTAADSDAGYDVNTALGDWDVTSSCEAGEGGTLVAYFAVRSTFNNSNARFGGAVGINTANVSSGSALTVSGAVVIMRAGTNVGRMPKAQLDVVGSISGSALSIMGNAGVGIASPLSKLHVKNTAAGDVIRADYTAAAAANYALSAYNDSGTMTFGVGTFSGYYEGQIFLTAPSGQGAGAGLNFTAGASKTGLFQLDSAGNMVFRNNNTGAGTYFDAATGGTFFRNNSGLSIVTTITNAGDVGIGTTTPGARLSVSGSTVIGYGIGSRAAKAQLDVIGTISGSALTVTSIKTCAGIQTNGNGVTSCTSDATLKDIQGSFTKGLSAIRLINPQTYSWKADSGLYDNGVLYSGFIAQNVQTGLPEAVNTGGNGKLQISQLTILAALVNGEKELDARTNSSAYLSIRGLALSGTGLIVSRTQTGSTNLFTMRSNVVSNDNTVFRVTAGGDVYADGAFNSGGADYAEYFRSDDSQTLTPGDLVCIDTTKNNAVRKCRTASDPNLMGIVSTHPAYIGNSKQGESLGLNGLPVPGYVLVGLIGQVPAKAIVEPGAVIQPGDSLTSAALAGFARKANPGETTVGVALEGLSSGQGVINVLISRTNKSLTVESLEAHVRDEIAAMEIGDEIQSRLNIALSGSTLAQNILDQAFDQVTPVVDALANRITDLEARVSNQESVGSGQTVVSVQGPVSSDLTLTGSVNAGTLSAENTLTVGSDTRIGGDLYLEGVLRVNAILVPGGLTVDGQLTTGKLTAASGSVVTGMLAVDDLMINHQLNFGTGSTINAQDLFVRGAMEVVGPITIHGLAQFLGDVEVQGELIVSAKQAGYALIHTGETSVFVSFGSGGFNAIPVVTASPDVPVLYAVSKASATGFTLRLAGPATEDVNFSWLALGTKTQHTASGAVITSTIAFPVDANGVPVSAQPIWNACIRNIPTFDSEGQPFNCSRYHTDTTWEHPDLNINFIWNDGMTPAYLDLPQGYVATITGPATLPESSSSSSVSSSDSSSSVSSDSSSSSSEISSESSSSSSSDEPIIIDLGSSSSSEQSSSSEAASSSESGGSAGGSSSSGN